MNHGPHGIHGRKKFWKSRLFWLGVPVLVFLVWAWCDSGIHNSGVGFERDRKATQAWQSEGKFNFTQMKGGSVSTGDGIWTTNRMRLVTRAEDRVWIGSFAFPRAIGAFEYGSNWEHFMTRSIAHWLVVLAYLTTWLASVLGWQRWQWKKLKEVEP